VPFLEQQLRRMTWLDEVLRRKDKIVFPFGEPLGRRFIGERDLELQRRRFAFQLAQQRRQRNGGDVIRSGDAETLAGESPDRNRCSAGSGGAVRRSTAATSGASASACGVGTILLPC
jgi:hypothetical protein